MQEGLKNKNIPSSMQTRSWPTRILVSILLILSSFALFFGVSKLKPEQENKRNSLRLESGSNYFAVSKAQDSPLEGQNSCFIPSECFGVLEFSLAKFENSKRELLINAEGTLLAENQQEPLRLQLSAKANFDQLGIMSFLSGNIKANGDEKAKILARPNNELQGSTTLELLPTKAEPQRQSFPGRFFLFKLGEKQFSLEFSHQLPTSLVAFFEQESSYSFTKISEAEALSCKSRLIEDKNDFTASISTGGLVISDEINKFLQTILSL